MRNAPDWLWPCLLVLQIGLIYLAGRRASSRLLSWGLQGSAARRWSMWILFAPGTVVHETSHALLCIITRAKIVAFVPYYPQRQEDGSFILGHVDHGAPRGGPIGGALIGIAPLFGVPLFCWGLGILMVDWGSPAHVFAEAPHHPLGWVWLASSAVLSLGALPSPQDHQDLPGALILLTLLSIPLILLGAAPDLTQAAAPARWLVGLMMLPACTSLIFGLMPKVSRRL